MAILQHRAMDSLHKAETGSNARHAGDGCPVSEDDRPHKERR
jgi:hypothetical protein